MTESGQPDSQTPKPIKIGEILIEQGVLSEQQVFEVLRAQRQRHLPFGVLAEQMFEVTVGSIEDAWVEQYHRFTGTLDLSSVEVDVDALRVINRRQAHQFELLPIRFEPGGELMLAASKRRLARAVTFATRKLEQVAFFRVAESEQLKAFLQQHYPMSEISDELVEQAKRMVG